MKDDDREVIVKYVDNAALVRVPLKVAERRVLAKLREKLACCPDFCIPSVNPWFELLLVRLCRFLGTRMDATATQENFKYLAKPSVGESLPLEWELQRDLYDFLASAGYTELERSNVAAGRVDIFLPCDGFRFVIEVKRYTDAKWSCFRSRAHVSQTRAYQATDVRLGVLATLDLSERPPGVPHFEDCIGVLRRRISSQDVRGVVWMRVPGNRLTPADAPKSPKRRRRQRQS